MSAVRLGIGQIKGIHLYFYYIFPLISYLAKMATLILTQMFSICQALMHFGVKLLETEIKNCQ